MTNEYIIDEDIANKICTVLVNCGENRLANKLCSRPAPSHSECYKKGYADAVANALSQHADCVKCLEEDRVTMLEHDAAIRKAERERVLDEIQQHALKAGFVRYDNKGKICNYTYINPKRLLKKIESLRGGA